MHTDADPALAAAYADELAELAWRIRQGFDTSLVMMPADQAVDRAVHTELWPVVLADEGNNTAGGSPGDGTAILAQLRAHDWPDAALFLRDEVAVRDAISAGVGARISVTVGGRREPTNGEPCPIEGVVRLVASGGPLPGHLLRTRAWWRSLRAGEPTSSSRSTRRARSHRPTSGASDRATRPAHHRGPVGRGLPARLRARGADRAIHHRGRHARRHEPRPTPVRVPPCPAPGLPAGAGRSIRGRGRARLPAASVTVRVRAWRRSEAAVRRPAPRRLRHGRNRRSAAQMPGATTTLPRATTSAGPLSTRMSVSGSPRTAMRSATQPGST